MSLRLPTNTSSRLQEVRRKEEEEGARLSSSFKANPVPNYSTLGGTSKFHAVPALTAPVSPNLHNERSEAAAAVLAERIEQEQEQQERLRASAQKAKPVPETTYKPNFTPKRSERAPLEGVSPNLATRSQSKNRAAFDQVNKERMDGMEKIAAKVAGIKRQEEEQELKELRNLPVSEGGMMVEANPIITEDQYPNTVGESPALTAPNFSPSDLRVSLRAMR